MEKLNSGQVYIVDGDFGVTSVKVIKSTKMCYLLRFKDSELNSWYTIDEFNREYEIIECLGYDLWNST